MEEKGASLALEGLYKLVDKYVVQNECKLKEVALEANVSLSTLYRIMRKEQPPSIPTALKLLGVVATPELTADFMIEHYPDHAYFSEYKKNMRQRNSSKESTKALLKSVDTYRLYILSTKKDGLTKEEASHFGEDTLNYMLESGAVKEINGRIKSGDIHLSSGDDISAAMKLMVEAMEACDYQRPSARVFESGSFSDDGIAGCKELLMHNIKEYARLKRECPGNIPCNFGIIFGEVKI